MKIPDTYEEFLKINQNDFNKLATSNLSLDEASKLMKFINLLSNDLKQKNIVLEKLKRIKQIDRKIKNEK
jgi:RAB protein geranylgeranyltransferase component A